MSVFNEKVINIDSNTVLHILDIKNLSDDLKKLIDKKLGMIHSHDEYNLVRTKKILIGLFSTQQERLPDVKIGMIAEFFIHLYLKKKGFLQLSLLQNLESTNDIKKGFDGYFNFDSKEWLMESKSTRTIEKHTTLVEKAYNDLAQKVSGKTINPHTGKIINPWGNAIKHLKMIDSDSNILKKIKKLSNDFIDENYRDIKDFNIIPSSTIFLEDKLTSQAKANIEIEISDYAKNIKYTEAHIICITQNTVDIFVNYLNK